MLYCDDFCTRAPLFPGGSVGGCYMLPLDLPTDGKSFVSSIRKISPTPPDVFTNQVFHALIPDIIPGIVDGHDYCDIDGGNVRVFFGVCGIFADHSASFEVLYAMKYSARAPCTHCFFRHA